MSYSLCPKVTIPEITRQSRALIAWLHGEASNFNADPSRIFVSGHSAGGQQVAMLSGADWSNEYSLPDDVIKGCSDRLRWQPIADIGGAGTYS